MARTEQYTVEQVAEALRACRGKLYLAARRLGCHANTMTTYLKRHKELRQVVEDARGLRLDVAEIKLEDGVDLGQPWAVLYTLSTIGKSRGYTTKQEVDHSGTLQILRLPPKSASATRWHEEYGDGDT